MQVYLETERLILRRFTPADADLIVELDSDPEVMRYLSGGPATPREKIEQEVLPAWLRYYERGDRYGYWAAIEKASGDFIGWFHFRPHPGDPDDQPELGYRFRRVAWGKGYGTEGSRALIRKGFTELGARRIIASTYQDNIGSRRVMEKCGLTFVRTFKYQGDDSADIWEGDDVEYAITREEWEQQQVTAS